MEKIYTPQHFHRSILCCSVLMALLSPHTHAEEQGQVLPTLKIAVAGAPEAYKSGNMDIPRTEDDVQAYTMIEREEIERSGATNVTEVITKLLPMATSTNNSDLVFDGTFVSRSTCSSDSIYF